MFIIKLCQSKGRYWDAQVMRTITLYGVIAKTEGVHQASTPSPHVYACYTIMQLYRYKLHNYVSLAC